MTKKTGNEFILAIKPTEDGWKSTSRLKGWNDSSAFRNNSTVTSVLPHLVICFKGFMAITVALYILNQKHLLPRPLSRVVSRTLFWPSMPITVARRIGHWTTEIDDTVIMGGAPFGFAKIPDQLHDRGVRGVVNLCEEYPGPESSYRRLGMRHLRLPTTDHFEPTVKDMERAVEFIRFHEQMGKKVYVHCRAGHGRSAAVVLAWMVSNSPDTVDLKTLNQTLLKLRDVRKTLWKQRNIIRFHARLRKKGADADVDDNTDSYDDEL